MQTLNFNCSHCGKLMAVGMNLLGRNVRCPHCKQVVLAPASTEPPGAAPPPAPEPSFQLPAEPKESHESIFGEVHDDDVFGTRQLKVQMPVEAPARSPEPEATIEMPQEAGEPKAFPSYQPMSQTEAMSDYKPASGPHPWDPPPMPNNYPMAVETNSWEPPPPSPRRPPVDEPPPRRDPEPMPSYSPRDREPARGGGGGSGVFIFILLLYSAAATAGVAYLYYTRTTGGTGTDKAAENNQPGTHPFSAIPDFFGEYDRAKRKEVFRPEKGKVDALQDVPKELRVGFGNALAIHNIEIVPEKIESREVTRFDRTPGSNRPTNKSYRMLLLHLRIKNTSDDVILHPTDPAFNARYSSRIPESPYTGIFIGDKHFLGGPWFWPDPDYSRQYVEGQENDDKPLGPGEERNYVVASTVDHRQIVDQLYAAKSGVWHVQLRTGLVPFKDANGTERDVSVTSVVGVPFNYGDVQFIKQ